MRECIYIKALTVTFNKTFKILICHPDFLSLTS